ncbi:hypothetical protein [Methanobrevibacter sp.]|uniref:hypothetical protein n=1 Tax=Methanobrevibacter sp. TaxID=66852 RepID=UPI00386CB0EE
MISSLEELKEKYPPYPHDMKVFNEFIETYRNQLLLLRENARVNNNERLYEAVQHLFEDYFQITHKRDLFNHFPLEVSGEYDAYLLESVIKAAEKVRDYYSPMWEDSHGIPLDHTGLHYSAGIIRWGDACSSCNRLAEDLKSIRRGIKHEGFNRT